VLQAFDACGTLRGVTPPRGTAQALAIGLAFIAAALSFTAVAITVSRTGRIEATPLFGGLLLLALGVGGYLRLRRPD
jgi:hypothetical protein